PEATVRPELALGAEPARRHHDRHHLGDADWTQPGTRLEYSADRMLARLFHEVLLGLPTDLFHRVVLRVQRLRCRTRCVGQLLQELLAALLRVDALASDRDATRSVQGLDPILHSHRVLHDHRVRAAELAERPERARLLEHPALDGSGTQELREAEGVLL